MDKSNLVEVTMETADSVIFRAISEIRGKSKHPDLKIILMVMTYPMAPFGKE